MNSRTASDLARYTSFPREPGALAENMGEFARDANLALKRRVLGYTKRVERYAATGSTATKIPLTAADSPPIMVLLGRVENVSDAAAPVTVTPIQNFYFESNAIGVYEPSGLTLNTYYNLTFLVVEA
jgi:hypothetical protein